jgi:hypothetical protein
MIEDDLSPQQRHELGDLQPLVVRLEQYKITEPDTTRLLAQLTPLLEKQRTEASSPLPVFLRRGLRHWLRLAWSQISLLEAPFWWSSAFIMLIGMLLGIGIGGAAATLGLLVLSPLIAVAGVAYLFRPATRTLWEFELLSQVQPLELLYTRLALILSMMGTLTTILLLVVWMQGLQIVLWRLLLIWLGPMLGVVGIALFCSVRWNNYAGVIVPLLLWGTLILVGWRDTVIATAVDMPNAGIIIAHFNMSNTIPMLAAAALVAGVFLIYQSGRSVTQ